MECSFDSKGNNDVYRYLKANIDEIKKAAPHHSISIPQFFEQNQQPSGLWKILRERTDKGANAMRTAKSVMESINNPVY